MPRAGASAVPNILFLVLVLAAIATYSMSLAPVTWVLISEIFPNRIRGSAMSIAVGFLWIACFLLTYTFPIFNTVLGPSITFWIYAGYLLRRIRGHPDAPARNQRQDPRTD